MNAHHAKIDVYYLTTDYLVGLLEQGIVPWQRPWVDERPPRNYSTNQPYRGINAWLLNALNYDHNLFLSWDEVRTLGGSLKKGARGHVVGFFHRLSGQTVAGTVKEFDTFEFRDPLTTAITPRYSLVFNIAQCTGLPNMPLDQTPGQDPLHACEQIVQDMPECPPIKSGRKKGYDSTTDTITMHNVNLRTEVYYATLFGHLVKSTSHPKRLDRTPLQVPPRYAKPYPWEELVIHLAVCYLCNTAGIIPPAIPDMDTYCARLHDELIDNRWMIIMASYYAQCAVDYVLGNDELAKEMMRQLAAMG